MRAEALRTVEVREVAAALDSRETVQLVQHNVSQFEVRRYLRLDDAQWWELMGFLKEREREHFASYSERRGTKTGDDPN